MAGSGGFRLAASLDSTLNTNDGGSWATRTPRFHRQHSSACLDCSFGLVPPEFFNDRFPDYSGRSPDQVCGRWKSTLHPRRRGRVRKMVPRRLEVEKAKADRSRLRRSDEQYRWFQIPGGGRPATSKGTLSPGVGSISTSTIASAPSKR